MTNTSVSSVSGTSSASGVESKSASSTKLTQATKLALQSLGVDTTNITTETQGQTALSKAKAEEAKKSQAPHGNPSEDSIKASAKSLATTVGVAIADKDSTSEIISKISAKITELKASAGEDKTKLAEVDNYQTQLDAISNSLASAKSGQAQLSGSMNGLANLNKIYQNLT